MRNQEKRKGRTGLLYCLLLGARTLLGAPGLTTRSKKLLGAPGIATRSKDTTSLLIVAGLETSVELPLHDQRVFSSVKCEDGAVNGRVVVMLGSCGKKEKYISKKETAPQSNHINP